MRSATIKRKTKETDIEVSVNLDGTGLDQVTYSDTFDGFPMFSPDGKKIIYQAEEKHPGRTEEQEAAALKRRGPEKQIRRDEREEVSGDVDRGRTDRLGGENGGCRAARRAT
jgi:Tol biopolymer transport system component